MERFDTLNIKINLLLNTYLIFAIISIHIYDNFMEMFCKFRISSLLVLLLNIMGIFDIIK